jgi:hypothetical protein
VVASQQTKATKQTKTDATKFLNYCATHPAAMMRYHTSDMILKIHSDASNNSESGARSQLGGHFYLGLRTSDDNTKQGTILANTAVMQAVWPPYPKRKLEPCMRKPKKLPFCG